jgi:hypothetical protein
MTLGFGLGTALLTFLSFSTFLPDLGSFRTTATVVNGLIFIIGCVLRYNAFRELAASQLQ